MPKILDINGNIKTAAANTLPSTGGTGTGSFDFGAADDFEIPNSATPTVDTAGQIAIDTTITDHTGLITYHDGTEALYAVGIPTGNLTATDGHAITYNATNNEFEMSSGGTVIQVVSSTKTDTGSITTQTFTDTGLSVSITPTSTSSTILVIAHISIGTSFTDTRAAVRLVRDSTPIIVGDAASSRVQATGEGYPSATTNMISVPIVYEDSPSTTSATTYKVQYRRSAASGTAYVNRSHSDTDNNTLHRTASSIVVMELAG